MKDILKSRFFKMVVAPCIPVAVLIMILVGCGAATPTANPYGIKSDEPYTFKPSVYRDKEAGVNCYQYTNNLVCIQVK